MQQFFVNAAKLYQYNKKKSEIKPNLLCLGNISKDFSFSSTKKKNRIKCLRVQCLIIGRLILVILPIFISI